jgi:hypothetical protein
VLSYTGKDENPQTLHEIFLPDPNQEYLPGFNREGDIPGNKVNLATHQKIET